MWSDREKKITLEDWSAQAHWDNVTGIGHPDGIR